MVTINNNCQTFKHIIWFLNLVEWVPAFIVTANSTEDIQKALEFANKHDLGVSVMGTGHEFLDRNAGPGPNSLLIRTTCFRKFEFNDSPIKGFIEKENITLNNMRDAVKKKPRIFHDIVQNSFNTYPPYVIMT